MADEAKPCRWKFLSVFTRLKNKFDRNREKYIFDLFWPSDHEPSPPHPAPEANYGGYDQPWAVTAAGQHDNEASASNQNSQYFDAEFDASAYWQQFQIGPVDHSVALQHGVPVMAPSSFQPGLEVHTQQREEWTGRGDGMLLDQRAIVPSLQNQSLHSYALHNQMHDFQIGYRMDQQMGHQMDAIDTFYPGISVDDYGYATDSEFSDAVPEWQRDDAQMVTSPVSASYQPSMSMMSVGTGENLRDTGESSLRPAQPDENQILERYLRDLKMELGLLPARPWHVIAFVKKLSGLWRVASQRRVNLQAQAQAQAQVCGSKVKVTYKGIRQRKNGKWVAEIRIGNTQDKVWLGSFLAEKEAALAYDAGLHHCSSKKNKSFNFKESPQKLGPSQHAELLRLEKEERKRRIQRLAEDHARAHGSTNIR